MSDHDKPACFRCRHYNPTSVTRGECDHDAQYQTRPTKVDAFDKCAEYTPVRKDTP